MSGKNTKMKRKEVVILPEPVIKRIRIEDVFEGLYGIDEDDEGCLHTASCSSATRSMPFYLFFVYNLFSIISSVDQ